jgi:hypothetical protein
MDKLLAVLNYLLMLAGMGFLVAACIACLKGKKAAALVTVPATLLILFANIDRVDSFKVGAASFEAKFKEKIENAQRIIDQLKGLAVNTAKSLIQLRETSGGIVTENPYPAEDAYKASVIQSLRDMDISPDAIKQVEQSDSNVVLQFYSRAAFRFASDGFLPDEKRRAEFDKAFGALSAEQKLSPDQIQKLFDQFHIDSSRFSPYMQDFRFYVSNKEQRRAEVWAKRGIWGFGNSPGSVFQQR